MDDRMKKIREELTAEPSERELYIMELEGQLSVLESEVRRILDHLDPGEKTTLEGYLFSMAELEWHTVVQAFQRGKELGIRIGESRNEGRQ